MSKKKLVTFAALLSGTVFATGCLSAFWQGMWNTGWPAHNRWLSLGWDILQENLFS
jgi:hypothetical protein